jgi:hypothetical protein
MVADAGEVRNTAFADTQVKCLSLFCIRKNDLGRTCVTYGRQERCIHDFGGET